MEAIYLQADEIRKRRQFVRIDEDARNRLRRLAPVLEEGVDQALEGLYKAVRSRPELRRLFREDIEGAEAARKAHGHQIAQGNFGPRCVESTRHIGMANARIGQDPRCLSHEASAMPGLVDQFRMESGQP